MVSLRFQGFWNGRFAEETKGDEAMATKSQIVSWMGVSLGLVQGLLKEVQKLGGGDEDLRKLVTPEGETLLAKFAQMVVGVVRQTFKVVVDYGRSLSEMVKAGRYDWVNENIISENFPGAGHGKAEREIVLFHFNRAISSDDAIKGMESAGYRPAVVEELLALGEVQPELQRHFPIVALGSVWQDPRGNRSVPYLGRFGAERSLDLFCFDDDWDGSCRFAAVRNA